MFAMWEAQRMRWLWGVSVVLSLVIAAMVVCLPSGKPATKPWQPANPIQMRDNELHVPRDAFTCDEVDRLERIARLLDGDDRIAVSAKIPLAYAYRGNGPRALTYGTSPENRLQLLATAFESAMLVGDTTAAEVNAEAMWREVRDGHAAPLWIAQLQNEFTRLEKGGRAEQVAQLLSASQPLAPVWVARGTADHLPPAYLRLGLCEQAEAAVDLIDDPDQLAKQAMAVANALRGNSPDASVAGLYLKALKACPSQSPELTEILCSLAPYDMAMVDAEMARRKVSKEVYRAVVKSWPMDGFEAAQRLEAIGDNLGAATILAYQVCPSPLNSDPHDTESKNRRALVVSKLANLAAICKSTDSIDDLFTIATLQYQIGDDANAGGTLQIAARAISERYRGVDRIEPLSKLAIAQFRVGRKDESMATVRNLLAVDISALSPAEQHDFIAKVILEQIDGDNPLFDNNAMDLLMAKLPSDTPGGKPELRTWRVMLALSVQCDPADALHKPTSYLAQAWKLAQQNDPSTALAEMALNLPDAQQVADILWENRQFPLPPDKIIPIISGLHSYSSDLPDYGPAFTVVYRQKLPVDVYQAAMRYFAEEYSGGDYEHALKFLLQGDQPGQITIAGENFLEAAAKGGDIQTITLRMGDASVDCLAKMMYARKSAGDLSGAKQIILAALAKPSDPQRAAALVMLMVDAKLLGDVDNAIAAAEQISDRAGRRIALLALADRLCMPTSGKFPKMITGQ